MLVARRDQGVPIGCALNLRVEENIINTTFNFTNKVAFVTGGVSGIGAGASLAFKRAGASVIACGVTEQELDAAKANPDFAGIRIEELNVRDDDAVKRLIGSLDQLDLS